MNYIEKILIEISRIKEIVEKWKSSDEIAEIERKIVKDYLARIYDEVSVVEFISQKQETEEEPEMGTEKKTETEEIKLTETTEQKVCVNEVEVATKIKPVGETSQQHAPTTVLGETLLKDKRFLSDDFAENDVLLTPIKDLSKGIGLNDKFLFSKELFGGNAQQFGNTITTINGMDSIGDALEYIKNNFLWQEDNPVVKHFITLVRRRFM
ncbi:MAG: hypothetical protein LBH30_01100 [Prevotellaceae bacterium]|jgi:hypothetical protein|nr:hypothetical protein [Prevotellaceae bacterium]